MKNEKIRKRKRNQRREERKEEEKEEEKEKEKEERKKEKKCKTKTKNKKKENNLILQDAQTVLSYHQHDFGKAVLQLFPNAGKNLQGKNKYKKINK